MIGSCYASVTLLHSERPKLYAILAFLSAMGLKWFDMMVVIMSHQVVRYCDRVLL